MTAREFHLEPTWTEEKRLETLERLEGDLFNFQADPEEASALIQSALGRLLEDDLIHNYYLRLEHALRMYAERRQLGVEALASAPWNR